MPNPETDLQYFVPLQSIYLARHSNDLRFSNDALEEYKKTGKAIGFTPGELRSIAEMSDAKYTGYLREPKAKEMPSKKRKADG